MAYWLMAGGNIEAASIRSEYKGRVWPYFKIHPDDRLRAGDVVYLSGAYGGLHSWGYVAGIKPYRDEELGEVLQVDVSYQEIGNGILVTDEAVKRIPELAELFARVQTSLEKLNARQINAFNQVLRRQGVTAPPDVSEDEDIYSVVGRLSGREEPLSFVIGQPVRLEENLYCEFKEVTGNNPAGSIKNTADEYAVAFLNRLGGRIFWGIRNSGGVVVGVRLDYQQRDHIRSEVSAKLSGIQPAVPMGYFNLDILPVLDEDGREITDLNIVELRVSRGDPKTLYATEKGGVWIKTDGGKRSLNHVQTLAEHERRLLGT